MYQRVTVIPERGLCVSTVRDVRSRACDSVSETMVFHVDRGKVRSWMPVYSERHPLDVPDDALDAAHERIVGGIHQGLLTPSGEEEQEAALA
ncbi:MAG TPA: hypothetical protein VIK99_10235 [Thermaerobacter sp.]